MKQLTCEMCGSTDLLKDGGVFVCQTCGCKYSVEEAKKMMVEGVVEVTGTVKVDDSAKIENYYVMAETAYEANNKKEAEGYCNKIIEIEPTNYKAWLLKGKAAGWQSSLAAPRIEESISYFTRAAKCAPEGIAEQTKADVASEITKLCSALTEKACQFFAENPSEENGESLTGVIHLAGLCADFHRDICDVDPTGIARIAMTKVDAAVTKVWSRAKSEYSPNYVRSDIWELFVERCRACISACLAANQLLPPDKTDIPRYKNLITIMNDLVNSSYLKETGNVAGISKLSSVGLPEVEKAYYLVRVKEYHERIREIDPTYQIPQNKPSTTSQASGCYVATAVYGSYDCPQVWTLRRFRDYTLAETW